MLELTHAWWQIVTRSIFFRQNILVTAIVRPRIERLHMTDIERK